MIPTNNYLKIGILVIIATLILGSSTVLASTYTIGKATIRMNNDSLFVVSAGQQTKPIITYNTSVKPTAPTINDIINDPSYIGTKVKIHGKYMGYGKQFGQPPVYKSDWVLQDDTGTIFVSGESCKYSVGQMISIYGTVTKSQDTVYIKVINSR